MKRAVFVGVAASIFAIAAAATGIAQGDYPSRPAQIVVPFPAGGNTDILTRVVADQLSTALKAAVHRRQQARRRRPTSARPSSPTAIPTATRC